MLLVDIAGRFHRDGANLSVTTGGVAIAASRADYVRSLLPPGLPKWGKCTLTHANEVTRILARECLAVCAVTRDLATPSWQKFWEDSANHESVLKRLQGGKQRDLRLAVVGQGMEAVKGGSGERHGCG